MHRSVAKLLASLLATVAIFSIASLLGAHAAGASCLPHERDALLAIKQAIKFNDTYDVLASWQRRHKHCCRWWGVTCSNETGHVIELDFGGTDLDGKISPSLLSLEHLEYLSLSYTNLLGPDGAAEPVEDDRIQEPASSNGAPSAVAPPPPRATPLDLEQAGGVADGSSSAAAGVDRKGKGTTATPSPPSSVGSSSTPSLDHAAAFRAGDLGALRARLTWSDRLVTAAREEPDAAFDHRPAIEQAVVDAANTLWKQQVATIAMLRHPNSRQKSPGKMGGGVGGSDVAFVGGAGGAATGGSSSASRIPDSRIFPQEVWQRESSLAMELRSYSCRTSTESPEDERVRIPGVYS
ncbi:hypothetical protein ZWY2020_015854 [Hordeum vulgare]|nr:hypothetical protein ZWY2020_015854 [Hordeum vulgare]